MARPAKGLEVRVVERVAAASDRTYVIHYPRGLKASPLLARTAQRLARKVRCPDPFPSAAAVQLSERIILAALVILALLLLPVPLASGRICQGRATRVTAWVLRRKRAHAAFRLSLRGGVASRRGESLSWILAADLPSSITYTGRRFSSRYTLRQSRVTTLSAYAFWPSLPRSPRRPSAAGTRPRDACDPGQQPCRSTACNGRQERSVPSSPHPVPGEFPHGDRRTPVL